MVVYSLAKAIGNKCCGYVAVQDHNTSVVIEADQSEHCCCTKASGNPKVIPAKSPLLHYHHTPAISFLTRRKNSTGIPGSLWLGPRHHHPSHKLPERRNNSTSKPGSLWLGTRGTNLLFLREAFLSDHSTNMATTFTSAHQAHQGLQHSKRKDRLHEICDDCAKRKVKKYQGFCP